MKEFSLNIRRETARRSFDRFSPFDRLRDLWTRSPEGLSVPKSKKGRI